MSGMQNECQKQWEKENEVFCPHPIANAQHDATFYHMSKKLRRKTWMNSIRAFFKEIRQVGQNDHQGPIPGEKEKILLQVYKQSIQCKHALLRGHPTEFWNCLLFISFLNIFLGFTQTSSIQIIQ